MRIQLLPHSLRHLQALRTGAEAYEKLMGFPLADGLAEMACGPVVSEDLLARLETMAAADMWLHGFAILHVEDRVIIGMCGYKGPPDEDGAVEIAYGVAPVSRGCGYATEAAQELVSRAFADGRTRVVRAHTLPEPSASTRVLAKCAFARTGEVVDPEDGLVWRWERTR
jgi:RimJ/RimL family protein N-acetyltransferase